MQKKILLFLSCFTILIMPGSREIEAATVQLPQTGQARCFDAAGTEIIPCAETRQDGDLTAGVVWPAQRFADNLNGTVTDNLTGLTWLKDANCTTTVGGIVKSGGTKPGILTWADALTWSNNLAHGGCLLNDGSLAGDWRLPNIQELKSLIDLQRGNPAVPAGHPFTNVKSDSYWTSSSYASEPFKAWIVGLVSGDADSIEKVVTNIKYVWPVRGGL